MMMMIGCVQSRYKCKEVKKKNEEKDNEKKIGQVKGEVQIFKN